jgi:biopolymer transport protein ExbD
MAGQTSNDEDVISSINITPLVDVVLVLLIIFLITAPVIYQSALKVQLPKAESGEEAQKTPLTFVISKEGELALDKEIIPWDGLDVRLKALGKLSDQTAVLSADNVTPHGQVIRLLDALRKAGCTKIAISVEGTKNR